MCFVGFFGGWVVGGGWVDSFCVYSYSILLCSNCFGSLVQGYVGLLPYYVKEDNRSISYN